MSLLISICNSILCDFRVTLLTAVIGYIIYKVAAVFAKRSSLPPGPTPVPLLGNILEFRKKNWHINLERIAKQYGPVMTLWVADRPVVVISDVELAKDAFRKNELSGRTDNIMARLINNDSDKGILFTDGPVWESLRRVSHTAVQKYATTERLIDVVLDCVDTTIKNIVVREGVGKAFDPFDYVYNLSINILYELDDPEYQTIRYVHKDMFDKLNKHVFLWDLFPAFRILDPRYYKMETAIDMLKNVFKWRVKAHYRDYTESNLRDLCDAFIKAKNESNDSNLTDDNLSMVLFDLIIAGADSSQMGVRWVLLHMLYDKNIEKKLRQEIQSEIGDRIPTHDDQKRCHYVMAFMSEVLRYDSVVPMGIPHKTLETTKIGDYTIKKDQELVVYQGHIMHQSEHWSDPLVFRPDRFLDNGKLSTIRSKSFIPFSSGRRICLGEKLAVNELFLILVRFLQNTMDFEIILHMNENDALSPDLDNAVRFLPYTLHYQPKPFKISLRRK